MQGMSKDLFIRGMGGFQPNLILNFCNCRFLSVSIGQNSTDKRKMSLPAESRGRDGKAP